MLFHGVTLNYYCHSFIHPCLLVLFYFILFLWRTKTHHFVTFSLIKWRNLPLAFVYAATHTAIASTLPSQTLMSVIIYVSFHVEVKKKILSSSILYLCRIIGFRIDYNIYIFGFTLWIWRQPLKPIISSCLKCLVFISIFLSIIFLNHDYKLVRANESSLPTRVGYQS